MPLPPFDVAAVRHSCEQRVPPDVPDELRIEADVHRLGVDVMEGRPPWRPDDGPGWRRRQIARFRWVQTGGLWRLYRSDRNARWRPYELRAPPEMFSTCLTSSTRTRPLVLGVSRPRGRPGPLSSAA